MARAVARRKTVAPVPPKLHLMPIAALRPGWAFEWEGVQSMIEKINYSTPRTGCMEIIDTDGNSRILGAATKVGLVTLPE